jgi:hypothetical protein
LFEAAKRRAMSASSQPTSLSAARVGVLPSDDSQIHRLWNADFGFSLESDNCGM